MPPQRIQRKRTKGWRMPEGARYVGRPGPFGNPWSIRRMQHDNFPVYWMVQDEDRNWYPSSERVAARFAVWMFRRWLRGLSAAKRNLAVAMFRNRDLACWCDLCDAHKDGKPFGVYCPDCAPCHADVLLELANR